MTTISQPPILSGTEKQQIVQIRQYLYQISRDLNMALSNLTSENFANDSDVKKAIAGESTEQQKQEVKRQLSSLKSLIIKTADVVRTEMDVLETSLNSTYVAQSAYGTFTEEINGQLSAMSDSIEQRIQYEATLTDDLKSVSDAFDQYVVETNGYIKHGIIGYDGAAPVIGIAIGAVWGFSRKFDAIMTEVYNVVANVPYILLISVIVLIMSASFWSMVFALTVTGWIAIAYFIRTQVIIIRDREYNLASRCLGTPITRIATKNILPFMTSVIVTLAAAEIPSYISYEVFLSYIGMGLSDMSLGKLIEASQNAMRTPGWEIEFWAPVAVASIITVVLYVVGQNLGDASDPRTHM